MRRALGAGLALAALASSAQADRVPSPALAPVRLAPGAAGGLERIRRQPIPRYYDLFIRGLAWFFAILVCTRLDGGGHDRPAGIVLSILVMALFIVAERLGRLLEEPLSDNVFGLPTDRFCTGLGNDILGPE